MSEPPSSFSEYVLPLEGVRPGEWAEVLDVAGEPAWVSRLAELGIRAGSRLRVLRAGCPCLLQVGGSRLSLRADSATQILVRPLGTDDPGAASVHTPLPEGLHR